MEAAKQYNPFAIVCKFKSLLNFAARERKWVWMSTAEREFIHFRRLKVWRIWKELLLVLRRYPTRNLTDFNLIWPQAHTLLSVVIGSWGLSFWCSVRPLVWGSANCKVCICRGQHTTPITHNFSNPTGFEPAITHFETRQRMWWAQFMFLLNNDFFLWSRQSQWA
jgi:hypothetical protein